MLRWMLGLLAITLPAPLAAGFRDAAAAHASTTREVSTALPSAVVPPAARVNSSAKAETKLASLKTVRDDVPGTAPAAEPAVRMPLSKALLIAPKGCGGVDQNFNVLIHFHGAYTTVEPILMKSGINAVYVIVNLGIGSGAYEDAFGSPGSLNSYLAMIENRVNQRCGGTSRTVNRVALSGWSAGYGAILRTIARPAEARKVDAVFLADGLHTGFEPGSRRRVNALGMQPFERFAESAARGETLMAITHSSIVPPTYASTTETANFLVDRLDVTRMSTHDSGPLPEMQHTTHAERGSLFIDGYAGMDARAHCTHLYAIGDTLWSRLRERWSKH